VVYSLYLEEEIMALIPRPKTTQGVGLSIIGGLALLAATLWYVMTTIDLIPDGAGVIGILDDVGLVILFFVIARKFIFRASSRLKTTKTGIMSYFQDNDLFTLLTSSKFWIAAILIIASIGYVQWVVDLIPDTIAGFGYLDDAIAVLTSFSALFRVIGGKK
jgi:uncharacterized membrane protein YkvA (DUF1232 family)